MIAGSVFSEEDTISCSVCCTLVGNGKLDSVSNFNSVALAPAWSGLPLLHDDSLVQDEHFQYL